MQRSLRKLRTYVGRLIRDIRRKVSHPDEALATLLARADRVRQQQPQDTHKLYSLHEPEVQPAPIDHRVVAQPVEGVLLR